MPRITDYTIASAVYATHFDEAVHHVRLESEVRKLIGEGWQPFGNVTSARGSDHVIFAQPMVKYAE